jgi:hypothetical protein
LAPGLRSTSGDRRPPEELRLVMLGVSGSVSQVVVKLRMIIFKLSITEIYDLDQTN